MTKTVLCSKYQEHLEALPHPPLPGSKGQWLQENVSKKAWSEWLAHQTMLINEKQLSLIDKDHRTYLNEQMERFLKNDEVDEVEGYVPKRS